MLGWYCIIRKPVWQTLALGGILGLVGRLVGLWLTCLPGRADVRFAGGELLVTANSIR